VRHQDGADYQAVAELHDRFQNEAAEAAESACRNLK
jgi:hypothetical protein